MPAGVVQIDQNYDRIYESRPLENVPLKRKLICGFLLFYNILCLILGICVFFGSIISVCSTKKNQSENVASVLCVVFGISLNLVACIYITIFYSSVYTECCVKQKVECFVPKTIKEGLLLAPFSCSAIFCAIWCEYWFLIAMIICGAANALSAIGNLHFAKKYCQCKTCHGIKDVKLTYGNVTKHVNETQQITRSNLRKWFNIPSSNNNHLAIQIKDGALIFQFYDAYTKVELHVGDYVIREIAQHLVPLSTCQSTTYSLSKKTEVQIDNEEKCTIMTID